MNVELQNEIKLTKELNQEMKDQFENEIQVLKNKNQLMESKMNSLETQILETKNILKDNNKETLFFKSQLENFNTDLREKLNSCHKEIESVKSQTPMS